jgi:outer membrane protein assembly factor BamA
MTTEDNYTMPNRTIEEYLELGYTYAYARALVSRAEAEQSDRLKRNVLATIDELNQYLLGNVTIEAATDAARELTHKLNESW